MKNTLLAGISFCAGIMLAANAVAMNNAERFPRWYVGLGGGVSFLSDSDIQGTTSGTVEYNTGGFLTASLGYMPPFGPGWNGLRFEAELGYRSNQLDRGVAGGVPFSPNGSSNAVTYMGNLYYDFRGDSQWIPYVGAGAGLAQVNLGRRSGFGNTDTSDSVFAYQLMAGVAYAPTSIPYTEWSLGYRFFSADDPQFASPGGNVTLKDYDSHNVELGARFRF